MLHGEILLPKSPEEALEDNPFTAVLAEDVGGDCISYLVYRSHNPSVSEGAANAELEIEGR